METNMLLLNLFVFTWCDGCNYYKEKDLLFTAEVSNLIHKNLCVNKGSFQPGQKPHLIVC